MPIKNKEERSNSSYLFFFLCLLELLCFLCSELKNQEYSKLTITELGVVVGGYVNSVHQSKIP